MNKASRTVFVAVLVAVALSLTGCTKVIDSGKAEKLSKSLLEGKVGDAKIDKVKCPSGKEAKPGTSFTCTFTGTESVSGKVKVEVKSKDGDVYATIDSFTYAGSQIESVVKTKFAADYPDQAASLTDVSCPDLSTDATDGVTCTLSNTDGEKGDLKVIIDESGAPAFDLTTVTPSAS